MQSIEEKNRQYRILMMDKNPEYNLFVKTKERPEGFVSLQSQSEKYVIDRGEEWLRLAFITEYEVQESS